MSSLCTATGVGENLAATMPFPTIALVNATIAVLLLKHVEGVAPC